MSLPPTYKPSPLSFGSPRTSPFQRPSSPLSPSTTIRPPTPTKPHTPLPSPSKLQNVSTPPSITADWPPRLGNPTTSSATPTHQPATWGGTNTGMMRGGNADALAKLPPAQAREMREAFQVLDRDGDGLVTKEDVADILTNLGQDTTPQTLSPFFPPSTSTSTSTPTPTPLTLPTFLSQLSTLLAPLSSRTELLNAFAAFDDDDSGQIDRCELRHALLHTAPEGRAGGMSEREIDQVLDGFGGKRTFEKRGAGLGKAKGEVFRYGEFVGSVVGSGEGKEGEGAK